MAPSVGAPAFWPARLSGTMRTAKIDRRRFLEAGALLGAAAVTGCMDGDPAPEGEDAVAAAAAAEPLYRISLAEWSYFRELFGPGLSALGDGSFRDDPSVLYQGELDHLDFPARARSHGIEAVEYVNTFFFDRARDEEYLAELRSRCDGEGVTSLLIMCDAEGDIGAPDAAARAQSVENHHKWVEAAAFLGCHAVRVNAASAGSFEEQQKLAADGLRQLCEYADGYDVDVLVENHGYLSSNGQWLAGTIAMVDHSRVGTLPDFGNFRTSYEPEEWYDRYQGVAELMPYARAVSAKSYDFDADGNETATDYERMMRIVLDAGYRGWVGIEFEGRMAADEGIVKTKELLERLRDDLAPAYA